MYTINDSFPILLYKLITRLKFCIKNILIMYKKSYIYKYEKCIKKLSKLRNV